MIRERTRLRNMRISEAKRKAETRALMIDCSMVVVFLIMSVLIVLGIANVVVD
jgi:competence protein ComGC